MTRTEIDALLTKHRVSFESRDVPALAADHTSDGTFESPAHGMVKGREQIAEVYRYWFTAFPDMRFEWDPPLIDGDRVALFWRLTGTIEGPFFGDVQPGTRVEMQGAAEYTMTSAGIQSARHVFDFSGALVKAGALKVKPA